MASQTIAELDYPEHVAILGRRDPALAQEFAAFRGISDVLAWMQRSDLTQAAVDIVGQDEFHYDFLIERAPGQWLAFGVT
jgi:hypothetical protein